MLPFLLALLAGAVCGLLTGAGVGGGTLLIIYLTVAAGMPQTPAQGLNLIYFLASAPPALIFHIKNKLVDVRGGIIAATAACLCAYATSLASQGVDETVLRRLFGGLLLAVGLRELLRRPKAAQEPDGRPRERGL